MTFHQVSEVNKPDEVETYPASRADLATFAAAQESLKQLEVPYFIRSNDPQARMFVSALDGIGNNKFTHKRENWSTVAQLNDEIETKRPMNIATGYIQGIGTRKDWSMSNLQSLESNTFDVRVETAYWQLCEQAHAWLKEDPKAKIRVVILGFSFGAEKAVELTQVIHKRGIQNPEGAAITKGALGLITKIEYAKTPTLVPPGKTPQACSLIDPVIAVNEKKLGLPSSVVSCMQLTAINEKRDQFYSAQFLSPGLSENNRLANFSVAGAHSNVGNVYTLNGLGARSQHLVVNYMNALSDKPFLTKQALPTDPAMDVIHRSEQHINVFSNKPLY